jgi:N-acetylmuramoyl-L-alanine amidase
MGLPLRLRIFLAVLLVFASLAFSTELTSQPRRYSVYWVEKQKYISLQSLIKTLNIQSWGRIEDRVFFEYQGKTLKGRVGSQDFYVDDQKSSLEYPIKEVESVVLFPLDQLEKILSSIKPAPAPAQPKEAPKPITPPRPENVAYTAANLQKPFVIIIDAGHGGHDDGARGSFGLKEKDVNLDISVRLRGFLASQLKNCPKVQVQMTRDTDVFLSLDERVEVAKKAKADIFFCVHTNSSRFNKWNADGFETYFPRKKEDISFAVPEIQDESADVDTSQSAVLQIVSDLNTTSVIEESRILAETVQENLANRLICPDRGAKSANFYVLKYTPMISVLVEVGFICNPNIEANLRDADVRQAISVTLGNAILQYLKQKQVVN